VIDADAALRAWLASNNAVTAFFTAGIEASVDARAGYKPSDGPLVLFNRRGGGVPTDASALLRHSYQFQCIGLTEALARQGDRVIFDAIQDKRCGAIRMVRNEQLGVLLREPATDWPIMVSYYTIWTAS